MLETATIIYLEHLTTQKRHEHQRYYKQFNFSDVYNLFYALLITACSTSIIVIDFKLLGNTKP